MNMREAKALTMSVLDRWRWLTRDKVNPRFVVIKNRRSLDPIGERVFADSALALRFAATQINPDYYCVVALGGP